MDDSELDQLSAILAALLSNGEPYTRHRTGSPPSPLQDIVAQSIRRRLSAQPQVRLGDLVPRRTLSPQPPPSAIGSWNPTTRPISLFRRRELSASTSLPRTFVSFSSADIRSYHLMEAWKAHEDIDFNFADFQLEEAVDSKNPTYIKSRCAAKIRRVDTFVLLIGNDTYTKTEYVQAEVEAAIEKGCRLIGVNLNNCRFKDGWCPKFFADKGAVFVPFSSRILAVALKPWNRSPRNSWLSDDWAFYDSLYTSLGYQLIGDTAVLPKPENPFRFFRPAWAK